MGPETKQTITQTKVLIISLYQVVRISGTNNIIEYDQINLDGVNQTQYYITNKKVYSRLK